MADKQSSFQELLKESIINKAKNKLYDAAVFPDSDGNITIDASALGVAKGVAIEGILIHAKMLLCDNGVSVVCNPVKNNTSLGDYHYNFDFNTEKGHESFAVGIIISNDRATFFIDKGVEKLGSMLNRLGI